MGTDRYAYQSKLRRMDPVAKLILSLAAVSVCLLCSGISIGVCTLVVMSALTMGWGGQRFATLLHFLRIPLLFLVIGCLTIVVERHPAGTSVLLGLPVGGSVWGITQDSFSQGIYILSKSMGAISSMYFLALNTPMTDLTFALSRLHVPQLMIELMELIYRFIFVLSDTARQIRTAQDSRLGYRGFRRSMNSVGTLASMVFVRAWKKANNVYSSLESRGYTGTLRTVSDPYEKGKVCYAVAFAIVALQLTCFFVEVYLL